MNSTTARFARILVPAALAAFLAACGGGGGGSAPATGGTTPPPSTPPTQTPPATDQLVTTRQTITAADCPRLVATAIPTPTVTAGTMQFVADVLGATDPNSGYNLFARLPQELTYWVNRYATVSDLSISYGVHETTHVLDSDLSYICNPGVAVYYFLLGTVHSAELALRNSTDPYAIADEALPAILKNTTTNSNYNVYILGAGTVGKFATLLDEVTAYTNGTQSEINIAASATYNYLYMSTNWYGSTIGTVDMMSYVIAYLRAARLNHPATYTTIQGLPQSLAYMQTLWTTAEQTLARAYPYSTTATGGAGFAVPKPALAWVYAPAQLAELDALGITHAASTAWDTTYLKP